MRDEADLVWLGAVAAGVDPVDLVERCDVAALARVVARVETASAPSDKAAAVLVGVARLRPFPASGAAAWLAAVHVLGLSSLDLHMSDDEAVALVSGVRRGALDEAAVAGVLAERVARVEHPASAVRRVLRWLWSPAVPRAPGAEGGDRQECRLPGRGREPTADRDRWWPVVTAPGSCPPGSFLAVVAGGGLVFLAGPSATAYAVVLVRDVRPGDLVGRWDPLVERGDLLGPVDGAAVRLDRDGVLLDGRHLKDHLADSADGSAHELVVALDDTALPV